MNFTTLKVGETKTATYSVKVDEDAEVSTVTNQVETVYSEVSKTSSAVTLNVEQSDLEVSIYELNGDDGVVQSGYGYTYIVNLISHYLYLHLYLLYDKSIVAHLL